MFESKKTQILNWILRWHEKSTASRQKKFPSRQKKFPSGLEDFAPIFGKLTAPYVMFESKKTQILNWILRWHEKSTASHQKKFPTRQKKFPKGLEDFAPVFGKLTTPYVMFESSLEGRNWSDPKKFPSRQKKFPSHQKKFPKGLEDFALIFCCWPPPMGCLKAH